MKLPRPQFSLRTLLIVVTLLALPLGWSSHKLRQAERQRNAVAKLQAMGFMVGYSQPAIPAPAWARKMLDDDLFDRVVTVQGLYYSDMPSGVNDEEALPLIAGLSDLQSLVLARPRINDRNILQLASLTKLQKLILFNADVTDDGLACLAGMSELESVDLVAPALTDAALIHLQSLHRLKLLYLSDAKITGEQLGRLNNLTALEDLQLLKTNMRLADLAKLKLPHLHTLVVSRGENQNLPAEPISPQFLHGLPALKSLEISGCAAPPGLMPAIFRLAQLTALDIGGLELTDTDLARIDQLQHLQTLNLVNAKISDRGLRALAHLPELTELRLSIPGEGGLFTEGGFAELQRALPKLTIHYGDRTFNLYGAQMFRFPVAPAAPATDFGQTTTQTP